LTYLDTSFVVSLYSPDSNSTPAIGLIQQIPGLRLISPIVILETVNAFELRIFRREITRSEANRSLNDFDRDVQAEVFRSQSMASNVYDRAATLSRQLTARLGTRAVDVLHVSAALEFGASGFFSFDIQQRKMAQGMGLKLCAMPRRQ
jgi:predicted nucleic acid-binding protein